MTDGVLAAAVDHGSDRWHRFVAEFDLWGFGEPPCVVVFHGELILATTPPVTVVGVPEAEFAAELTGVQRWREVPSDVAGDLTSALTWARAHVGRGGAPADADRLPLKGEVDDDPPKVHLPADGFAIAALRHARLRVEVADRAAVPFSAWVESCRTGLLAAARAAFPGPVDDTPAVDGRWIPNVLHTEGVVVDRDLWPTPVPVGTSAWRTALAGLDEGGVCSLSFTASVASATGGPGRRWGTLTVRADNGLAIGTNDLPSLQLELSESFLALTGDQTMVDTVQRTLATYPLTKARVTFDRTVTAGPWIAVVPRASVTDPAALAGAFEIVAAVPGTTEELAWLQVTGDPRAMTAARASAAAETLRAAGLDTAQRFFTHRF